MRRIVIADAGPVIALARIGQLELLPRLFGTVWVTSQVAQELDPGNDFPESSVIRVALRGRWLITLDTAALSTTALSDAIRDCMNLHQVDLGEASAIAYGLHLRAERTATLLLIDDFRGRSAAQHAGLALLGTAGVLLLAKQAGAIAEVKPLLLAMRKNGYYLGDRLIAATLEHAQE